MLSTLGQVLFSSAQAGCLGSTLLPALQIAQRSGKAFFASKANLALKGTKATPPYLDEGKPKRKKSEVPRAISAYAFYVKEHAAARKGKAPEIIKVLAQEWNMMSEAQKQPYLKLAETSKASSAVARAKLGLKVKAAKPPPAAYAQFYKEVSLELTQSNPGLTAPARMQQAAARWRAMSEAEKEQRKAAAIAAREAWKLQNPTP